MQKAKIIVAVRKRPLFEKQKSKGASDIIAIHNGNQVVVSEMKQKVDLTKYIEESVFNFDHAFDETSTNQQIYNCIMSPLIDSAFQGAKVSCFAYGQTGSGKTYTMNGVMSKNIPGLYTLGACDIFERLRYPEYSHLTACLSFYEIYCTKLFDLLNKRNQLILREDAKSNINVVGLSEIPVSTVQQFQTLLKGGSAQRVTSQNSANSQSSRSHAILQISLKNGKKGFGKIYFIDLAGNQRGADHMNMKKQTQIDGQQINKSLLQLKQCIRGLDQGKNHVPFRGSKLTMCLKDSFIGFCRTVMIGNISPSSASSQNTLNTLRYADRVKELKNSDEISKQELKSREMMLPRGNKNAIKIAISNSDDEDDIAEKKRKALQEYGIKPEQKRQEKRAPSVKEDNLGSDRRLSMGGPSLKNNPQPKGSSLAKNGLNSNGLNSNGLNNGTSNNSNRQIPSTKGIDIKPKGSFGIGNKSDMQTERNESSNYQNRPGNQPQMEPPRYRGEPMEIERPHGNSVDLRKNLSGIVDYGRQNNFSQNNSNIFAQQPQLFNDYNTPNHQGYQNYQQNSNPNPVYKANNFFSNNQSQQQPQVFNQIPTNNRFNPPQQPINNNRPVSSSNNSYNSMQQQNYPQNFQQPQQQGYRQNNFEQKMGVNQPRQGHPNQNQQINPQSWNQMVDVVNSTRDVALRDELRDRLNDNLFSEETDLINQHSTTLQTEIQKIKSQMEVIKIMQHDRSQLTSREYAQMMMDSIDDKISMLQQLRERVTTFTYKLDDMEAVEESFDASRREHHGGEDEQLLDDFE